MNTDIPLTIDGNLTADPETGVSASGKPWARLRVAVNDRRLSETTNQWEDAGTVFHDVAVFGKQAEHVARSLHEGDTVLVAGKLRFGMYDNPDTGQVRETRQIIADTVAVSLRYRDVTIDRAGAGGPHATGPEIVTAATRYGRSAPAPHPRADTGPVTTAWPTATPGLSR